MYVYMLKSGGIVGGGGTNKTILLCILFLFYLFSFFMISKNQTNFKAHALSPPSPESFDYDWLKFGIQKDCNSYTNSRKWCKRIKSENRICKLSFPHQENEI
jgi:hypothetical protein